MRGLAASLLMILTLIALSSSTLAATNVLDPVCGTTQGKNSELCKQNQAEQRPENNSIYGPNGVLTKATRLVSMLVAIAAVIVIIVAGLQYILSTGDSTKVNQSKNAILYALVGLGVAAFAQLIVALVISRL